MSVSCVSCEFKDRGFYDGPITHPEEFNRVCVCVRMTKCNNNPLHLKCVG